MLWSITFQFKFIRVHVYQHFMKRRFEHVVYLEFYVKRQSSQQSSDEIYPKINIYESFKSWIFSIYLYKEDQFSRRVNPPAILKNSLRIWLIIKSNKVSTVLFLLLLVPTEAKQQNNIISFYWESVIRNLHFFCPKIKLGPFNKQSCKVVTEPNIG